MRIEEAQATEKRILARVAELNRELREARRKGFKVTVMVRQQSSLALPPYDEVTAEVLIAPMNLG